ncbi:toll-interacting protein-like isoform X2 [Oratosquilla oratoria]|uniref:toll-interacting protein-like isoform X2 n=1 Tax=Oratosquilla oratoria TaxID=337810 RepID=UPI003F75B39A
MATTSAVEKHEEWRKLVVLGDLPDDFLRPMATPQQTQEQSDHETAMHLQQQMIAQARAPVVGRLQVTLVSAVLNKNYGMTRMDPYVRLRLGHHVYETHTDVNGAKNPHWNKTIHIYHLPKGVGHMTVEIFDERTLTDDELIAWVKVPMPDQVFQGETVDEWYTLSGKLGEGQEGTINIVLSCSTAPAPVQVPPVVMVPPNLYGGYGPYTPVPVYTVPATAQTQPQPATIKEEDLKQLGEMFPEVEKEVIQSVMEASYGNKETAINSLLQMQ